MPPTEIGAKQNAQATFLLCVYSEGYFEDIEESAWYEAASDNLVPTRLVVFDWSASHTHTFVSAPLLQAGPAILSQEAAL